MTTRTIRQVVADIALGAAEQGMDVSPKDVGWIISTFCEALSVTPDDMMQKIADEAAAVKDEE